MIGVFDSGVGGLSVLKKIREKAPLVDVVYFGDIANAPYGQKSEEELKRLTAKAVRRLLDLGADSIVSACNSVSAHMTMDVLNGLSDRSFGIIEMVGPATRALKEEKDIAILATPATIRAGMYQREFAKYGMEISVYAVSELARAIEEGENSERIEQIARNALNEVKKGTKIIMLSCTHYPLARDVFEREAQIIGMGVRFFDPADSVADEVVARFDVKGQGRMKFFVSKRSDVFERLVEEFFGNTSYTIEVV